MKIFEAGHIYHLTNKSGKQQTLTYFKDIPPEEGHDGVLCQEVIRSLIDRVKYLDNQVKCEENIEILSCLRKALLLFETRASRRYLEKRLDKIESLPVDIRGHVLGPIYEQV